MLQIQGGRGEGVLPAPDNAADSVPCEQIPDICSILQADTGLCTDLLRSCFFQGQYVSAPDTPVYQFVHEAPDEMYAKPALGPLIQNHACVWDRRMVGIKFRPVIKDCYRDFLIKHMDKYAYVMRSGAMRPIRYDVVHNLIKNQIDLAGCIQGYAVFSGKAVKFSVDPGDFINLRSGPQLQDTCPMAA